MHGHHESGVRMPVHEMKRNVFGHFGPIISVQGVGQCFPSLSSAGFAQPSRALAGKLRKEREHLLPNGIVYRTHDGAHYGLERKRCTCAFVNVIRQALRTATLDASSIFQCPSSRYIGKLVPSPRSTFHVRLHWNAQPPALVPAVAFSIETLSAFGA